MGVTETQYDQHSSKPSALQTLKSLPRTSKFFLIVCIVQAAITGTFAVFQITETAPKRLQDLILILVSAIYLLYLVIDAFFHENGYQLLVCMASGTLNLIQLIVYATNLQAGADDIPLIISATISVFQILSIALARYAYLGFGWRTYSKISSNVLLPDADKHHKAGLRLHRFSALAKFDVQLIMLLFVVGLVNGINPGRGDETPVLPTLLVVTGVGCAAAAIWLAICWFSVLNSMPRLRLAAEFSHPVSYVAAGAFIMSGAHYSSDLGQIHGEVGLIAYSVLFVVGTMAVWWDARLISADKDLALHLNGGATTALTKGGGDTVPVLKHKMAGQVHPELVPLVRGSWLIKLPTLSFSTTGPNTSPTKNMPLFSASSSGRWRFFQLSSDGSTLRWDWRKYVLLMHVEDVVSSTEDLTITLSLTLEPDLRLKFPDAASHAAWTKGLKLLLRLLGNPDGLDATKAVVDEGGMNSTSVHSGSTLRRADSVVTDPGSPTRLLQRFASASYRASAAGLFTQADLDVAAERARRALHLSSSSPTDNDDEDDAHTSSDDAAGTIAAKDSSQQGARVVNIHAVTPRAAATMRTAAMSPTASVYRTFSDIPVTTLAPVDELSTTTAVVADENNTTSMRHRGVGWLQSLLNRGGSSVKSNKVVPAPPATVVVRSNTTPASWLESEVALSKAELGEIDVDKLKALLQVLTTSQETSNHSRNPSAQLDSVLVDIPNGLQHTTSLDTTYTYPSSAHAPPYYTTHHHQRTNSRGLMRSDSDNVASFIPPSPSPAGAHSFLHTRHPSGNWPHASMWGADGGASARSVVSGGGVATPMGPITTMRHGSTFNVEFIDYSELTIGRMLGEGAEGPVHAAWFRDTPVAVKRTHRSSEVDMHLHAGSHDNVVSLRAVSYRGEYTYLVMELCPRGTLDVLIHQQQQQLIEPVKLLPIVRSIARGMLHLHTRTPAILHRDIKPANIFIGHGNIMKIGDFGMARPGIDTRQQRLDKMMIEGGTALFSPTELQRTLTPGVIGTAAYCAPELLVSETPQHASKDTITNTSGFDPMMLKADVYSFGVTLWELCERKRPYAGMDSFQVQTQWVLDPESMRLPRLSAVADGHIKQLSPAGRKVMMVLSELVEVCTAWEPTERPTFKDILCRLRQTAAEISEM